LRRLTPARIALGRAGGSVPTRELLAFNHDHALARDAVQAPLATDELVATLRRVDPKTLLLASAASDRTAFLRRPDLGRQLRPEARAQLAKAAPGPCDLVIVVSDGLSSLAALRQAPALLEALLPKLAAAQWTLAPVCVIPFARVGIIDDVGATCQAALASILLGERPGLGAPDSLGAYFEYAPAPGRTDADRNCISNIRPAGIAPAAAADKLLQLLSAARRRKLSGIGLKEERATLAEGSHPVLPRGEVG
jgi:ethanolamine ammonia-lyase small subunit